MPSLKLSIVLCTYNGERFLKPQLDSLLSQERLPDEIVINDDASGDGTVALLDAFAERARRRGIEVQLRLHQRNTGYVSNFIEGLRAAKGDLLFLCDQDDIWHADKLVVVAERFEKQPSLLLLGSNARLVDADGADLRVSLFEALELTPGELQAVHGGRAFDVLLRRSMITGATAALRKDLLERLPPVGAGWIHDEWLAAIAAALGGVDVLEQSLIEYRQHGSNAVGMHKRGWRSKWRDLVRPRRQQFEHELHCTESLQAALRSLEGFGLTEPLRQLAGKRDHFARRINLGDLPRWWRLPPILAEARSGNYHRYGTGVRSMLRDLLRRD
jgi:glycosyltransferase involved in cell wall biosynthesis